MRVSWSPSVLVLSSLLSMAACAGTDREEAADGSPLPPLIASAEGLAEDVQSDLERGDWTAARARLDSLHNTRSGVDGALTPPPETGDDAEKRSGEMEAPDGGGQTRARYGSALDSLGAAIERQDSLAALEAANRMSRALVIASGGYVTPVPPAVGLLDVSGRDAGYYAQTGRWDDAQRMVDELRREYARVSAHVRGKDPALSDRVSADIDAVAGAVAARNAPDVRRTAAALLEAVDAIEKTYP